MDLMEKFAAMKPSQQIGLLAETTEKLAAERDALVAERDQLKKQAELDELYHQLEATGQNLHSSREETMAWLTSLDKAGELVGLKASMKWMPGSIRKVASGLSAETDVAEKTAGAPDLKASRTRFIDTVMGGVGSDDR
jgi:hypothetical protein